MQLLVKTFLDSNQVAPLLENWIRYDILSLYLSWCFNYPNRYLIANREYLKIDDEFFNFLSKYPVYEEKHLVHSNFAAYFPGEFLATVIQGNILQEIL
jgi:hypothetical protein